MVSKVVSGVGRRFLFQVLKPTPGVRLVMEFTSSFASDAENLLPPAAAIGAQRRAFGMGGRGSARVFSPPLEPQEIEGRKFVDVVARGAYPVDIHNPNGLTRLTLDILAWIPAESSYRPAGASRSSRVRRYWSRAAVMSRR